MKRDLSHWKLAFKYLMFLVFPIWLLDGCLNRDPLFYVDKKYRLIGVAWGQPLQLQIKPVQVEVTQPSIDDVKDFRMTDRVLTGKCMNGHFIVNRTSDDRSFYATPEERDSVLKSRFGISQGDLKPLPATAEMRGNFFFPYNLIFYFTTIALISLYCWQQARTA